MTKDEIKKTISLQDVFEKYGIVGNAAGFYNCPFHSDKTASLKIKADQYKCFGCNESGDIFNFIEKIENISFRESINFICTIFSLSSPNKLSQKQALELNKIQKAKVAYNNALKEYERYNYNRLCDFHRWLYYAKPPKNINDEFSRQYILKMHYLDMVERMLDNKIIVDFDVWIKQFRIIDNV